jgi:peptidoglycan/LPS O-acetylase OafA/YrhL
MLVLSFLCGVIAYLFKRLLPYNRWLCLACAVAAYVFLSFPNLVFLSAAPLAYVTVYLGLTRPRRIPFGDLSYGVYLFHFPIARSIFELTDRTMAWEALLLLTVLVTSGFAALSWNFIEKPILVAAVTGWISERLPRVNRSSP